MLRGTVPRDSLAWAGMLLLACPLAFDMLFLGVLLMFPADF